MATDDGTAAAERVDSPLRAIAYLVIGLTLLSLQDVIIKSMSGTYAVHQIVFIRGLIAGVGFYLLSQAYRLASPSTIAPFEYSSLPRAILWGFLVWGDLPEQATIAGIVLVAGSGLYIIHREAMRDRKVVRGRPLRPRI